MKRFWLVVVGLACACSSGLTDDTGGSGPVDSGPLWEGYAIDPDTLPAGDSPCHDPIVGDVKDVTDGDTIQVKTDEGHWKVRFIGIDTPEVGYNGEASECYGDEAKEFVTEWLEDQYVWLTFDSECRDPYDRWLAYIHVDATDDGFVERLLLNEGYASVFTVSPNDSFSETFESDQSRAKALSKGIWSQCD
jgi:micrococcal nuclease